ncbi:hypothetical protein C8N46_101634 [Kordia periserrulae]|uniref:Uncharacterized protein n=1 Tax=Kordia periserrulae TaxID=701523 RepID=A0A2T6C6R4_9FLAO|nr:class I lanthipeptide [Kordia periserrulae]PTX64024.1 hypothetical protein C8N46_101634 [Kordia periserrulae]
MKKKKANLKKLSLNKKVVSNLESQQANGGAPYSVNICPINTFYNCPINTLACPNTLICPIDTRLQCPIDTLVCPIETIECPTLACPIDTVGCPY